MLIVAGNALGVFAGPGKVILFSVDLSPFCWSFGVESNTTIEIYIAHDVLLIIDVHNVIEGNNFLEILTTIWYKIIFWTQKRMNCKLCRIIGRDLSFNVVAHRFLQREQLFNFDRVELRILIVSKYWWEFSPIVGYVDSSQKRLTVVGNNSYRMIFQSSKLLLFYGFNQFIPALFGQLFLFWSKLQRFPYMVGVSFPGDLVQVLTLFCFSIICSE